MKETKSTNQKTEVEIGDFGPIYRQFEGKVNTLLPEFIETNLQLTKKRVVNPTNSPTRFSK